MAGHKSSGKLWNIIYIFKLSRPTRPCVNVIVCSIIESILKDESFIFGTGLRMVGSIPKKGTVAEPGFVSIAPGNGVTTIDPVSVCLWGFSISGHHRICTTHQKVSTMTRCILPTSSLYQFHASGPMGSPTLPRTCRPLRSWFSTWRTPRRRRRRMAVGAE